MNSIFQGKPNFPNVCLGKLRDMGEIKFTHIQGLQRALMHHIVACPPLRLEVLRIYGDGRRLIEVHCSPRLLVWFFVFCYVLMSLILLQDLLGDVSGPPRAKCLFAASIASLACNALAMPSVPGSTALLSALVSSGFVQQALASLHQHCVKKPLSESKMKVMCS